jgi:phenylpyruvate tautomerase PptA (4-oxalocrotonate tautomerase family)
MPLVRIEIYEGRSPEEVQQLADTVHEAAVTAFAAPPDDRFQIIQQHPRNQMIMLDFGLGFNRTDKLVVMQIASQGRTVTQKQAFYAKVAELFEERGIAGPDDLIISMIDNTRADWSLGRGRAQFIVGDI